MGSRAGGASSALGPADSTCDYHCDGIFRNVLTRYEGWHGYVALVVSWFKAVYIFIFTAYTAVCSTGLYIWHDCQYPQHHRVDPQRYVQDPNKHNSQVAGRCRHVCHDRVHPVLFLSLHFPR